MTEEQNKIKNHRETNLTKNCFFEGMYSTSKKVGRVEDSNRWREMMDGGREEGSKKKEERKREKRPSFVLASFLSVKSLLNNHYIDKHYIIIKNSTSYRRNTIQV